MTIDGEPMLFQMQSTKPMREEARKSYRINTARKSLDYDYSAVIDLLRDAQKIERWRADTQGYRSMRQSEKVKDILQMGISSVININAVVGMPRYLTIMVTNEEEKQQMFDLKLSDVKDYVREEDLKRSHKG